jgi:hypothetical protein
MDNFIKRETIIEHQDVVRATLSSVQGAETSRRIRSINIGTRIQEQKYYAPSGGIRREEKMRIPTQGKTLHTNQQLPSSMCPEVSTVILSLIA